MNFRDLQEAIQRLANDPRVHPTTRIEVEQEHQHDNDGEIEHVLECEPLVALTVRDHVLVLSSEPVEPAVVR